MREMHLSTGPSTGSTGSGHSPRSEICQACLCPERRPSRVEQLDVPAGKPVWTGAGVKGSNEHRKVGLGLQGRVYAVRDPKPGEPSRGMIGHERGFSCVTAEKRGESLGVRRPAHQDALGSASPDGVARTQPLIRATVRRTNRRTTMVSSRRRPRKRLEGRDPPFLDPPTIHAPTTAHPGESRDPGPSQGRRRIWAHVQPKFRTSLSALPGSGFRRDERRWGPQLFRMRQPCRKGETEASFAPCSVERWQARPAGLGSGLPSLRAPRPKQNAPALEMRGVRSVPASLVALKTYLIVMVAVPPAPVTSKSRPTSCPWGRRRTLRQARSSTSSKACRRRSATCR